MDQEDSLIHPATQPLDLNLNPQTQHSDASNTEMNMSVPHILKTEPVSACSSADKQQHEETNHKLSATIEDLDQLTSPTPLEPHTSSASRGAREVLGSNIESEQQSKDIMASQSIGEDQHNGIETLKMSPVDRNLLVSVAAHGQIQQGPQSIEEEGNCREAIQDPLHSKNAQADTGRKFLTKQVKQGSSEFCANRSPSILPRASTDFPENVNPEDDSSISAAANLHNETEETSSCKKIDIVNEDQNYIIHYNVLADEGRQRATVGDITMEADSRQPLMTHSMNSQSSAEQSADDVEENKINVIFQEDIAAAAATKLEDLEDPDTKPSRSLSTNSENSEGIAKLDESATQEAGPIVAKAVRALFARAIREAEHVTAITRETKGRVLNHAHQNQPAEEDNLPEQGFSITKDEVCLQSKTEGGKDTLKEPCQQILHGISNQSSEEILMPGFKCFVTSARDREKNESNSHSSSPEGSETLPQKSQQSSGNNTVDQDYLELPTSLRDSDIQTSELVEKSIAINHSMETDSVATTNDIFATSSDTLGEPQPLESHQRECLSEVSKVPYALSLLLIWANIMSLFTVLFSGWSGDV